MNNEERRHRDNLLLMCHRHHVETDDVDQWPVARMREIKAGHERRFEEAVTRIAESTIVDITKSAVVGEPKTLRRFGEFIGETPDESAQTLQRMVLPLLNRLRMLAPDTRSLLLIVLERGERWGSDVGLPLHELEQVTGLGSVELQAHVDTLARYGIAYVEDDFDGRWWVGTYDLDGWEFWRTLKSFCESAGLDLSAFVSDLRFDLLD